MVFQDSSGIFSRNESGFCQILVSVSPGEELSASARAILVVDAAQIPCIPSTGDISADNFYHS